MDEARNIRINITINKDMVNGVLAAALIASFLLTIACESFLVRIPSLIVFLGSALGGLEYNWKLISEHKD